jgi:hypothetical protein
LCVPLDGRLPSSRPRGLRGLARTGSQCHQPDYLRHAFSALSFTQGQRVFINATAPKLKGLVNNLFQRASLRGWVHQCLTADALQVNSLGLLQQQAWNDGFLAGGKLFYIVQGQR